MPLHALPKPSWPLAWMIASTLGGLMGCASTREASAPASDPEPPHAFHLAGVLMAFVSEPPAPDPVRVRAVIEIRHAQSGELWVEHVQTIDPIHLPMAFNLRIQPPHPASGPMRLRGALIEPDGDAWVSDERLVHQWPDTLDLGVLRLTWQPQMTSATHYDCDGQRVSLGLRQGQTWLRAEGTLMPLEAVAGSRPPQWRGEGATEVLMGEGGRAPEIRIRSLALTGCRPVASP